MWRRHLPLCHKPPPPSVHTQFLAAEEKCNQVGGYLADVLDVLEQEFLVTVLGVINPKVAWSFRLALDI